MKLERIKMIFRVKWKGGEIQNGKIKDSVTL